MKTSAEIIDELGGTTVVADAIGAPVTTVSAWKYRKSIPFPYWDAVIRLARARGVSGVTKDNLMKLALAVRATEKCA